MFKIYDGRNQFYQWDIDRKLIVEDATIDQVHFCNRTDDCSLVCETYTENGLNLVNVPNILLQTDWRINVYAYDRNYTKFSEQFDVVRRSKPESYVYTETEVLNYNTLLEMIESIEGGDLTGYATEEYVDNAVANVKVDLTGYATEKYVDDAIDAIEIPKTDLTGYATEKYVDDAIAGIDIPEVDFTGYATEQFVTDAVGAIKIPDVSGFTTMAAVESKGYQTEEQVNTLIDDAIDAIEIPKVDLTDYATKQYVDDVVSNITPGGTSDGSAVVYCLSTPYFGRMTDEDKAFLNEYVSYYLANKALMPNVIVQVNPGNRVLTFTDIQPNNKHFIFASYDDTYRYQFEVFITDSNITGTNYMAASATSKDWVWQDYNQYTEIYCGEYSHIKFQAYINYDVNQVISFDISTYSGNTFAEEQNAQYWVLNPTGNGSSRWKFYNQGEYLQLLDDTDTNLLSNGDAVQLGFYAWC